MMTTTSRTPLVLERIDDDRCPTTYYSMAKSEAGGGGGGGGGEKEKRKGIAEHHTALPAGRNLMFMFC